MRLKNNSQPATRRGGELGFTLVEVLVALTILVIGLLGVALMQVVSIQGNTFSREMAVATGLGQDMLEKLRTLQWTELNVDDALTAGDHPIGSDINRDLDGDTNPPFLAVAAGTANIIDERGFGAADVGRGPLLYTRTWTITDNQPATNMKTIEVTVLWKEKGTTDRSVTISGVKVQE
ncbi:MAG TPA: prepilin-type N-terminal cleavage/methylation domain-containing protein [Nitrospirae bacterium]|nr:prepilin-type N-terminal cleavage/methylation domain-containing protein [Nitrospirota bacterium]